MKQDIYGKDIPEEEVDFTQEEDTSNYLTKEQVKTTGAVVCEVIKITKDVTTGKNNKDYTQYHIKVRIDKYTEKEVRYVFRNEMTWGKVSNPKKIKVEVIPDPKDSKYLKWKISSFDGQLPINNFA